MRAVFTGLSALAKVDFAALVVAVLWCAWGSGAVPPIGTGGFEALVGGVTGCTGGWAGVSALGTAWSSVLGAVLGRWSGDSVAVSVFVACGSAGVRVVVGGCVAG